ncbi:hypothetical protein AB0C59_07925 [Streptomyces sp. NPDC048664]
MPRITKADEPEAERADTDTGCAEAAPGTPDEGDDDSAESLDVRDVLAA